jgi:hypothetical protein
VNSYQSLDEKGNCESDFAMLLFIGLALHNDFTLWNGGEVFSIKEVSLFSSLERLGE